MSEIRGVGKPTEHALRMLLMGGAKNLRVSGFQLRVTKLDLAERRAHITLELVDKDGKTLCAYAPNLLTLAEGETATIATLDRLFDFKIV